MVVNYDSVPPDDHLSELIEKAREYGCIATAKLTTVLPINRDLDKDF